MKLTDCGEIEIADAKLGYLLNPRAKDDKSKFLQQLGFTIEEPEILREAILLLVASNDAVLQETTQHGQKYRVTGELVGPTGSRAVLSVFIERFGDEGTYRLVTMYPSR